MSKFVRSESDLERNERLERLYRFDTKNYSSVLAYVSENTDWLEAEFRRYWWSEKHSAMGKDEALHAFEIQRFGAPLYPSAHGVLLRAVREVTSVPKLVQNRLPYKD